MAFDDLASLAHRVFGSIHVPASLRAPDQRLLVHASDLPSSLYAGLARLLDLLKPSWLVLSGDLADEIKLELNRQLLPRYERKILHLRAVLEPSLAAGMRLVLASGNHDDEAILATAFPEALLFGTVGRFRAGDLDCAASHWWRSAYDSGAEYLLFGHDLSSRTRLDGGRVFLNGVEAVNIIDLATRELHFLSYPAWTDDARLRRYKIGM